MIITEINELVIALDAKTTHTTPPFAYTICTM